MGDGCTVGRHALFSPCVPSATKISEVFTHAFVFKRRVTGYDGGEGRCVLGVCRAIGRRRVASRFMPRAASAGKVC